MRGIFVCSIPRKEAPIPRSMGLDVGDARIGMALSDPLGILASPYRIITRRNTPEDIQSILKIAADNGVGKIIVGLPVNMDGTLGGQAEKVKEFAGLLKSHTGIPVEFRDERLTTVEAKHKMHSTRKPKRDTRYDAAAAALILQSYLDDSLPREEIREDDSTSETS